MSDVFSAMQIIAEHKIQEAMQAGAFDNLPGTGKPLELEDLGNVPEELRMAYKILKNAGCVPDEIAQRNEIANLTQLLDNCADEKERIIAMRKLRCLLDRMRLGSTRNAMLEANDEYYQKAIARLARLDARTDR